VAEGPNPPQNPQPGALVPDTPTAPQVLAELELVRRKAELLEKRMVTLESTLVSVQKALRQLEAVAPNASPAETALAELQHRIGRLERRRAAEVRKPATPSAVAAVAPVEAPRITGIEAAEAKAIVNADWSTAVAAPGEDVRISALLDGYDEGVRLSIVVRSIATEAPLAQLEVPVRDSRISANWKVPASQAGTELFFEVTGDGRRARSGTLVVLVAGQ
jgi:hypothetical protein